MYRFIIFNEKILEVQTLLADEASVVDATTIIAFITDGEIGMLYNLPAGYSLIKEDA